MGKGFLKPFIEITLYRSFVRVVGNEAAARWQGQSMTKDGGEVTFERIKIFNFNNDDKIVELRGFLSLPGS